MKETIGKTKCTNSNFPSKITINNQTINNNKAIAESFNNFFINVGSNLAKKISESQNSFKDYIEKKSCLLEINNFISEEEIKTAFKLLKLNKSPGYDDISVNVVKRCQGELLRPLQHIFSICFNKRCFLIK